MPQHRSFHDFSENPWHLERGTCPGSSAARSLSNQKKTFRYDVLFFCEFCSEYGGLLVARSDAIVISDPSAMSLRSLAMSYIILMVRTEVIAPQSRPTSGIFLITQSDSGADTSQRGSRFCYFQYKNTLQIAITPVRSIKMM